MGKSVVKVLIFDTDYIARIENATLDGKWLRYKDYTFSTEKIRPFILQKGLISQPLYIFKSTSMIPLAFQEKTERVNDAEIRYIEPIQDIKFYEKGLKIDPRTASELVEFRFLKELGKYVGVAEKEEEKKKNLIIFGIILLVFGALLFLFMSNPEFVQAVKNFLNIR